MRLPVISYLSILAGAAALLTLSGCSTSSRYYGNDGPPTVSPGLALKAPSLKSSLSGQQPIALIRCSAPPIRQ